MTFIRPALGLLQGVIIYALINFGHFSIASTFCAIIILTFPLFALQVKLPERDTLALGLGMLIMMAIVYGFVAYHLLNDLTNAVSYVTPILAAQGAVSAFIVFIFYCVVIEEKRFAFSYATLFSEVWQIILKLILGQLLVTLTMGLCTLAALLFQLLDIPFIQKIVFSPAFFYIMPPFFFGIAMTILHQYEQILTKLRNILLAFCKFLYPIFVVICLAFLLAIPFANRAFADFWPVIVVLSAFNILLFNGIFQAGLDKEPYVHWFCYLIYACFILSALYSLFVLKYPWLEMWNYGMTPLALLLLIALIIHALYNVSYSLAIFFSQKPWLSMIKPVNTMLALFIAVVYLILALPWFHIGKIAAHNQLARLLNNKPIINPQNPNLNQGYLVGANLQGANLQGRDLRNIDFSHANLQGANLSGANLEHANLQAANLSHSNLNKANLTRTQLSYADLSQANLSNTELNRAWLNQAILNGTNLTNADLQQAFGLQQKNLDKACGTNVKLPQDLTIKPCP